MDEKPPSLVVVGASAGGVEALSRIVRGLPADLPAAVAVVLHVPAGGRSRLPEILSRAGALDAAHAVDGERLSPGRIYVASPDRHLVVRDGHFVVARGPRENGVRPSVDVLFRSAAFAYGPRTVAVVLSGSRDDGVAGAVAVSRRGGTVIVQDPAEAVFAEMPSETVARDHPDRVLPLDQIPQAVVSAVENLSRDARMSENQEAEMNLESKFATLDPDAIAQIEPPGESSPYSCPACGGVLWELEDDDVLRFRCRTGHAYTAEAALDGQAEIVEQALWVALRALRERAQLSDRIARRAVELGANVSQKRFEALAREAREQAEVIRRALEARDARER